MGGGPSPDPPVSVKPVRFRPRAAADVHDAYRWYEDQRPGLGDDFLAEIEVTIARARAAPLHFPEVRRSTRRALVERYPYSVLFLDRPRSILVVAVYHAKRDPRGWRGRR